MSSQPGHGVIDPAAQSKMPLFESAIALALSKAGHVPDYLKNRPLPCSGSYYSFDPRGKDGADFTYAWSNPKTALLENRSSVGHLPGMEKPKHIAYRPDNGAFSTEQSPSLPPPLHHIPNSKHGFTYYTRSPEISSPAAPPFAVRNKTVGNMSLPVSPPSENSAHLTVPKPYYGHSPCCNDLSYMQMLGQRYSMGHGQQKMSNMLYDCTSAHYAHQSPILTKAPETLMQKKGVPLEYNAERLALKDITEEQYHGLSPSRARTMPVYSETNYNNYPCTPTRTPFGPFNEQSQSLQTPHSLHPSHPLLYEHMASVQHRIPSQVYHDHPPISKYGQLPQLHMFYYPQANAEAQSGAVSKETGLKHREDVLKHTCPSPQRHYMIPPPSVCSEVRSTPGPIVPPNHPFPQGFDHLCYPGPTVHLDASQMMRAPMKRLHIVPTPSLYSNDTSPPRRHVEQHSPSKHADRQRGSPANMHLKRVPFTGSHMAHPNPSPARLHTDEPLDYSQHKSQGRFDGAMLNQSPARRGTQIHRAVPCSPSPAQQITGSSAVVTGTGHQAAPHGVGTYDYKRNLKRSASSMPPAAHTSLLLKTTEDNGDVFEMEELTKRQKMEVQRLREQTTYFPDSPPMPVIGNVFSLAPHLAPLDASGDFNSDKGAARTGQFSESGAEKHEHCVKANATRRDGQKPVCSVQTEKQFEDCNCPHIPIEKIKVEGGNEHYTDCSEGKHFNHCKLIQDYCKEITIKQELEEPASSHNEPALVIKKCEPDEFESKPFITVKNEPSESTERYPTAQMEVARPTQDETETVNMLVTANPPADRATPLRPKSRTLRPLRPKSTTPPLPTENQVKFKNIPPHCLKLSTGNFNIVVPDSLCPKTVRPTPLPDTQIYQLVMAMPKPKSDCQDFKPEANPELKLKSELHKDVSQDFQPEAKLKSEPNKLVPQQFLEIHQSKPKSGLHQLDCQDFKPRANPELKPKSELHKDVSQDFQPEAKPKSELNKLVPQPFLELHQSKPKSGQHQLDCQDFKPRANPELKLSSELHKDVSQNFQPEAKPKSELNKVVPQPFLELHQSKPKNGQHQLDCQDLKPRANPELKHKSELHKDVNLQLEAKQSELDRLVRQHFLELHQSLCKLVCDHVSLSPEQEVKTWLSQLEPTVPAPPSTKVQNVTHLLGDKVRKVWLNEEIKIALHKVLQRLREYIDQSRCPFPHVMRTGMVFIPMLVVKELMFPQVNGSFIDQVLQLHKIALRPATLSEEKILIQLHKSACSSKLRRLLSLKCLPDIYADVINLYYHACVCKHLGVEVDEATNRREQDKGSEEACTSWSRSSDAGRPASQPFSPEPQRFRKEPGEKSLLNKCKPKSRVKRSSKCTFLDDGSSSSEDEVESTKPTADGGVTFQGEESWESWTRPLTPNELASPTSNAETEGISSTLHFGEPSGSTKSQARSKKHSGMIIKLRRVLFNKGHGGVKSRYQRVAINPSEHSFSEAEAREDTRERGSSHGNFLRRSKVTHRWHRTAVFSHTLRPLSSSSKRRRTSLLRIKYCPYLSACHSAEHRRRWVLRSSVQRARWAMKLYPDLVGKRIRHLYEEDDKTEVWYRGEVVRVHETHANPLKTVFEVRYDSEPDWQYYLELLLDYTKGWLKIDA